MYCSKCGSPNDDNAWNCVQCGEVLARPSEMTLPPPLPPPLVVVPSYLAQAILCTIFCCVPFGIPAIVYAAQVSGKAARGDMTGALASSKNAKTWCYVSLGAGLVIAAVYLMAMIVGVLNKG
jgi:hypothetical protein